MSIARPARRTIAALLSDLLRRFARLQYEPPVEQHLVVPLSPTHHPLNLIATDEIPLQEAVREGRQCVVVKLLERSDVGQMMELTPQWETPLHLAARNGHLEVTRVLLDHARGTSCCRAFVNARNCLGETALHLAASRNDLQVLKLLLEDSTLAGMVEVNAKTNCGSTALDILDEVLPEEGEVKKESEQVLQRAGGLRGKEIMAPAEGRKQEVLPEVDERSSRRRWPTKTNRSRPSTESAHLALILATIFATMTFHAALRIDSLSARAMGLESVENSYTIQERSLEVKMFTRIFVLFNSMAFFSSLGLITILLHHLPLRPWLLILVASSSGAYVCAVMASSVDEVTTVVLVGASILTAAILNCLAFKFNKVALNHLRWICKRYRML